MCCSYTTFPLSSTGRTQSKQKSCVNGSERSVWRSRTRLSVGSPSFGGRPVVETIHVSREIFSIAAGSVPFQKNSVRVEHCASGLGRRPDTVQISLLIMSGGSAGHTGFFPRRTRDIISFQIGAAPVIPETSAWFIGVLSLFPTHTVVTYSGVYPIVQLSRKSFVVPVFALTTWLRMTSSEDGPNAPMRALLSNKMCETR